MRPILIIEGQLHCPCFLQDLCVKSVEAYLGLIAKSLVRLVSIDVFVRIFANN